MRFEQSIEINATQDNVWAVVSDVERWPERTASIKSVKLLNSPPFGLSSEARIEQPKLPATKWQVTKYDPPSYFEWVAKSLVNTTTAGHRVVPTGAPTCRLTLTLEWRGIATPLLALLYKGLTNRYLTMECEGMKRAAESSAQL